MGVIRFTAQLQPRGPAAAVVLDDDQVTAVGEGAEAIPGGGDRQRLHLADQRDPDAR